MCNVNQLNSMLHTSISPLRLPSCKQSSSRNHWSRLERGETQPFPNHERRGLPSRTQRCVMALGSVVQTLLPYIKLATVLSFPLEEKVGNHKAQETQSRNNLHRNSAGSCLLYPQTACSSRDSLLGILVDRISLSLAQSLVVSFLTHSRNYGLRFGELGLDVFGRGRDRVHEAWSRGRIRVGRSVDGWVSSRLDNLSKVLVAARTVFRKRNGTRSSDA
jgi:hypothetical protein